MLQMDVYKFSCNKLTSILGFLSENSVCYRDLSTFILSVTKNENYIKSIGIFQYRENLLGPLLPHKVEMEA